MKKTVSVLLYSLLAVSIVFPAGFLAAMHYGYLFKLASVPVQGALSVALSASVLAISLARGERAKSGALYSLPSILTPLSLINVILCADAGSVAGVVLFLISAACLCFMAIKYVRPLALKIAPLAVAAFLCMPVFFSCFILAAGDFVQNTVVQTISSTEETYYAEVIDNDQGALGGSTRVIVRKHKPIVVNAIVFTVEREPKSIYAGGWGAYNNMTIYWKNDSCLVVDSVEYNVDEWFGGV
ncbi:MAG: hypothetical protein IJC49_06285 [Clostridia bacterium]|nr:hypothetical protein [Clostridia bacterium]